MNGYFISQIRGAHEWKRRYFREDVRPVDEKRFNDRCLLPADILFLNGDLSEEPHTGLNIIKSMMRKYSHVVFLPGEEDCMTSPAPARGADFKVKDYNSYLRWLREQIRAQFSTEEEMRRRITFLQDEDRELELRGLKIAGQMGFFDGKISYHPEMFRRMWYRAPIFYPLRKLGVRDFLELSEAEVSRLLDKISPETDLIMTHFPPFQILDELDKFREGVLRRNSLPNKIFIDPDSLSKSSDPGASRCFYTDFIENNVKFGYIKSRGKYSDLAMCTFDGSPILDVIKDGAIWHSSHIRLPFRLNINYKGKRITFLNNPCSSSRPDRFRAGRELGLQRILENSDFLIDFS